MQPRPITYGEVGSTPTPATRLAEYLRRLENLRRLELAKLRAEAATLQAMAGLRELEEHVRNCRDSRLV